MEDRVIYESYAIWVAIRHDHVCIQIRVSERQPEGFRTILVDPLVPRNNKERRKAIRAQELDLNVPIPEPIFTEPLDCLYYEFNNLVLEYVYSARFDPKKWVWIFDPAKLPPYPVTEPYDIRIGPVHVGKGERRIVLINKHTHTEQWPVDTEIARYWIRDLVPEEYRKTLDQLRLAEVQVLKAQQSAAANREREELAKYFGVANPFNK